MTIGINGEDPEIFNGEIVDDDEAGKDLEALHFKSATAGAEWAKKLKALGVEQKDATPGNMLRLGSAFVTELRKARLGLGDSQIEDLSKTFHRAFEKSLIDKK